MRHATPTRRPTPSILVAEDSIAVREIIATALELRGYRVQRAVDGAAALALLDVSRDPVDLLITDSSMPRLDGLSLIRAVRAHERYANLPALYLSSASDPLGQREAWNVGANAVLHKPIDLGELLLMADAALGELPDAYPLPLAAEGRYSLSYF